MLRKVLTGGIVLAVLGGVIGLWLTQATALPPPKGVITGDIVRGEQVFWAAGCASCHTAPDAPEGSLVLAGGQTFPSDFGTFVAPNVSMDPTHGIGGWTEAQFLAAVRAGVSPDGAHYYPVFPYTAYALADPQDLVDLWAFWQELPADPTPSKPHGVGLPFSIRRAVGAWKLLNTPDGFTGPASTPEEERGRYLAEALGHCAECHTPRDALGGLDRSRWMAGAPNPSGQGRIPDITPAALTWSQAEIAAYLNDGFTPDFDSAGGHMVSVIRNLSRLPEDDRKAIAAYLKALTPHP